MSANISWKKNFSSKEYFLKFLMKYPIEIPMMISQKPRNWRDRMPENVYENLESSNSLSSLTLANQRASNASIMVLA